MKTSSSYVIILLFSLLADKLNHSMEFSPSREGTNCAAIQELPSNLCNPKVHYYVHKSPPLVPIFNLIDAVHTTPSHPPRSIFYIIHHLHFGIPCSLFPSALHTNNLYASPPFMLHALSIPYPPWLDHSNYTWQTVWVMAFLFTQLSPTSCHFLSLRSKYSPSSSLNVRDQVLHQYRTTSNYSHNLIFMLLDSKQKGKNFWTKW
jgi:hypothetical protein